MKPTNRSPKTSVGAKPVKIVRVSKKRIHEMFYGTMPNSSSVSVADAGLASDLDEMIAQFDQFYADAKRSTTGFARLASGFFWEWAKRGRKLKAALESSTQTQEGVRREIELMKEDKVWDYSAGEHFGGGYVRKYDIATLTAVLALLDKKAEGAQE